MKLPQNVGGLASACLSPVKTKSRLFDCEGPRGGAPVEIAWPEKRNSSPRDLLISLRVGFADFATAFTEVIDFVPYEDSLKQSARDRYKAYRVAGFNLNTATWK